ncbi:polysaccharide biosynthesis/export family protein [Arenicella xantha]|uniref:Protein involved in polysaccharide export with SLBB domain n=1 Tax=Arenicella xantha TaxID=644221 RepID=A0A395JGQ1_9GAMM|nr:polysaccharide biosynthesis/export family protein [Arenicella xantha]RBP49160.1 protein involved in polysaccharide export with SLBB domain [Arenicella xantha]
MYRYPVFQVVQSPTLQPVLRATVLYIARLFLALGILALMPAQAHAQQAPEIKQIELLSVYLTKPYQKIADVPASAKQVLVSAGRKWSSIQFTEPTVPGWISEDYVRTEGNVATVAADILNVRLRPSSQSRVMYQLENGYQSSILGRYAGFLQVLLPADFTVAVREGQASDAESGETVKANASNVINRTQADLSNTAKSPASKPTFNAGSHRIAPGDAISLLVFGEPDLSIQNVRVPQNGQVSFPLVGPVTVAGKTTAMIESEMEKLLEQGYVKNPRLSVTIFSYRPIFIRGSVNSTGAFPYTEGLTVAKAIALAGGSKAAAKQNGVSILRDGATIVEDLAIDSTFEVASGDVISVTEEYGQAGESFIYIHGEVQQPGEYIYRRGLTVEKAIVLASGFSLRASKRKVSITRYAGTEENEKPTEMKRVELFTPVEPGDVINVGASWF